ncbi:cobalt-precorrin-6A reductase [Mesorhizobium sp. M2D.F.Ca.ET.185.01.1.1]|uniref:cobalt-precorrin-6A reductase n=1 Tax=unclassified Mesorhizobium TaxID=325217 RepID=UPI000FCA01DA|nr:MULTISPECIES: cobalt-precorrin-6A reductase [unclassified Mesorhizobium]TGP80305.1 cobalt-precorrin-6A reductase [bacterium M00.F.Ca.ET.227.01.1.1]TGQ00725.1 cobalt-precorrin-6A reductase [bacterium M00.F.Ca.ET.221.01.1.1]TGQ03110.1 cobalt-precorrin-6A reductase [bacterium M00.F.Ca.ET.222.01.1.1]TGT97653.1 cobalt-precorrin-6A reductase [bacterium M00.F.Ca.ET.163.01.1.1]TGU20147.1 cobalt-precorrin-6A reductase [bacterium M00.F.Ca.ET.156.01.1.1]TGU44694.1 cobalt-precorrin-6A reductase [bacte
MTHRILILGGTTEARQLAGKLVGRKDFSITLSLAGRTESPVAQGVPFRVGGFGGAEGLAGYLGEEHVDLLIDATHPYAARISANAAKAATKSGVPIFALRRPGWEPVAGDRWTPVESVVEAASALGTAPRRVFLAIGRQESGAFEAAPQHNYLIRSVDPVEPKLAVPDALYLLARGPFPEADERALLEKYGINAVVSKNSGGDATYGKIAAARALGIEVVMIRRPPLPDVPSAETVDALAAKVDHLFDPVAERGV